MRIVFMFLAFVVLLGACKGSQPADTTDVLVSVKGRTLNRSEVNKLIPRGISSADSLLLAESFTKKWVKDVLVYDVALRNLGDEKEEVDKLVEEYRRSLVRYRYQERLGRRGLEHLHPGEARRGRRRFRRRFPEGDGAAIARG